MTQWTRDHVLAAVQRYFSDKGTSGVLKLLDQYEDLKEQSRVQVAILKLSDGDLGKLRHNIDIARQDYRDVLWWSELPVSPEDDPIDGSLGKIETRPNTDQKGSEAKKHGKQRKS